MNKQDRFPFNRNVGDAIGRGQDNVVVPFKGINKVLKWNHNISKNTQKRQTKEITNEEHFNRLLYKKRNMN
jgi:hypothetical protein